MLHVSIVITVSAVFSEVGVIATGTIKIIITHTILMLLQNLIEAY